MKKYNVLIAVVMFVLAGAVFYATKDFPKIIEGGPGPGQWPRILSILLILLSIFLLIEMIFSQSKDSEPPINCKSAGFKKVLVLFGILIAFGFCLSSLGFIIASFLFIPTVMYTMGEKRIFWLLAMSAGVTAVIYIIFELILNLMLPLPFFY